MADFNKQLRLLLKIKPAEIALVKQLFLVQFLLGVATAFLFISSLTLFLDTFKSNTLPQAYIVAAILLLISNILYARLEALYSSHKLLLIVIWFSVGSIFCTWLGATFFALPWLPFFLAAWNLVVYMLVGYAFWGMAAITFNVRESKRLFTVVGSGDIPAKMISYVAVALLAPLIGVTNLLWFSIAGFLVAYYLLYRFQDYTSHVAHEEEHHHALPQTSGNAAYNFVKRLFEHRLIFYISMWSVVAFTIYALIDFTFLIEIKARYKTQHELAAFISIFFTIGRFLAILFKLFLSSRLISRLGLANTLLIAPVLLLGITGFILSRGQTLESPLYIFGIMVLVSEILKSVVQDPVFFVLFQPLKPHLRLKGHLIAKGYTLPFALLGSGLFLAYYYKSHDYFPISLISQAIAVLLIIWVFTIFLIKREYLATLLKAIQKGYFTGTELFLNQKSIRKLLLNKTKSTNPNEVINALDLLEKSGYTKITALWLQLLQQAPTPVKNYIISRVIQQNLSDALPIIRLLLEEHPEQNLKLNLIRAFYYLQTTENAALEADFDALHISEKKAALVGILSQPTGHSHTFALKELTRLASESSTESKMLAIAVISETSNGNVTQILQQLLSDDDLTICKNAIVAVGKTRNFTLLPLVMQKVVAHNLLPAFGNALLQAGDEVYNNTYLTQTLHPTAILKTLIQTAGKTKGEYSDNFLLSRLNQQPAYTDLVTEALWAKKNTFPADKLKPLEPYIQTKLNQTHLKMYYHQCLAGKPVELLVAALKSEIEQDLQKILKAFALLYNRASLDRIIHLYRFGDTRSFSNAIEILEIMVPKRYFSKTDAILEFLQDIKRRKAVDLSQQEVKAEEIISDILTQNKAGCNTWTQSVAHYVIPGLEPRLFYRNLLIQSGVADTDDYLVKETRDYVLTEIA